MLITLKAKLLTNTEQYTKLLCSVEEFNKACQFVSDWCFLSRVFAKFEVHKKMYHSIRNKFSLPSQMAVRAIGKVCESYKNSHTRNVKHIFDIRGAIVYDQRNLAIRRFDEISISTLNSRETIKILFGGYESLDIRRVRGQADLYWDKTNKCFYLMIAIDQPEDVSLEVSKYLGVDLGITNIATDSMGEVFSGKEIKTIQNKVSTLKSKLQSVGTHSAKKHLKKLAKKEYRQKTNYNHIISKHIVQKAKTLGVGVKLEDLTHFKRTAKPGVKKLNKAISSWAFAQLRRFIEYKAKIAGVPVALVNPAYSSQTCSKCGHCEKDNRLSQSDFKCLKCGYEANADFNAAVNISRGTSITSSSSDAGLGKTKKAVAVVTKVRTASHFGN